MPYKDKGCKKCDEKALKVQRLALAVPPPVTNPPLPLGRGSITR